MKRKEKVDLTDLLYIPAVVKYLEYKGESLEWKNYYWREAIKYMSIYGGTYNSNSLLLRQLEEALK